MTRVQRTIWPIPQDLIKAKEEENLRNVEWEKFHTTVYELLARDLRRQHELHTPELNTEGLGTDASINVY